MESETSPRSLRMSPDALIIQVDGHRSIILSYTFSKNTANYCKTAKHLGLVSVLYSGAMIVQRPYRGGGASCRLSQATDSDLTHAHRAVRWSASCSMYNLNGGN